jgi:hypothetical protein
MKIMVMIILVKTSITSSSLNLLVLLLIIMEIDFYAICRVRSLSILLRPKYKGIQRLNLSLAADQRIPSLMKALIDT